MAQKAAMTMLRIWKRARGFTLVEVMVSVTILAICFVLILNSFVRSTLATELSDDFFRSTLLFEDKLYEMCNAELDEGFQDGVFSNFGNRFSWRLHVVKLEELPIKETELEISWNQGSKKKSTSALTYLYAL